MYITELKEPAPIRKIKAFSPDTEKIEIYWGTSYRSVANYYLEIVRTFDES
jgi:hypothetical protein